MAEYSEAAIKQDLEKNRKIFSEKLRNLRTGRARPESFNELQIEAYGALSPLNSLANVVIENALSVIITPYDRNNKDLANEIVEVVGKQLGLSPVNEGDKIRINIPALTEETRKQTVKEMDQLREDAKIHVRKIRQKYKDAVTKSDLPEDEQTRLEKQIQNFVDDENAEIDRLADKKEAEIMSI